jgi:DNA modification methylase
MEYIFHFVRDTKNFKTNMDVVRVPYAKSSINRYKTPVSQHKVDTDGIKSRAEGKMNVLNPLGSKPPGVFRFDNAGVLKGVKHPAPFHPDLPKWFIKFLSDKGDIVLDPFMGGGTTAEVALDLGRDYIGFEKNKTYVEELVKSIENKFKSDFWE